MKDLKSWLDQRGMSPDEAGKFFGKAAGTIRNWRSKGVPKPQQDWVEKRADQYESSISQQLPERLTLEYSPEQFDKWNQAALDKGKLTRDWAVDTLDAAAREAEQMGLYNRRHAAPPALAREKDPGSKN